MSNYPDGAEFDPSAPWNEREEEEREEEEEEEYEPDENL